MCFSGISFCDAGYHEASASDVHVEDSAIDCPSSLLSDGVQMHTRDGDVAHYTAHVHCMHTSSHSPACDTEGQAESPAPGPGHTVAFLHRSAAGMSTAASQERSLASASPSYVLFSEGFMGQDDGDSGPSDDPEGGSTEHAVSADGLDPPPIQTAVTLQPVATLAAREQHPDVALRGRPGRPVPLLALLDQHLLDRVLLKVAAGSTGGALNAPAASCRRLRNAVRRIAGSAGPPAIDSAPPVDTTTAALDIRALHSFPSLHTLRLPKLDRGAPMLPVDLFRLRRLTLLTHLDVACAVAVPSFQPLRLLPNLRKLSVSGVTLAPPPDIPEIPACEVTLYANRALTAATRSSVLAALPPLSGVYSTVPAVSCIVHTYSGDDMFRAKSWLHAALIG